jgi:hypothetical protein
MSDKWEHAGSGGNAFSSLVDSLFGLSTETVQHTETGEYREVVVGSEQTVGEAIEKGQFTDKSPSDWKK